MNRRDFLKNSLISTLSLGFSNFSFANLGNDSPTILFVFLRGGADSMSMLVPYSDPNYYENRPTISLKKEDCLEINSTFGISPFLPIYKKWYDENSAVFIPLAGQTNNSRSHFQARDVVESGIDDPAYKTTGFIDRLNNIVSKTQPICFNENLNFACRGANKTIPNLSVKHITGEFFLGTNFDERNYGKDFSQPYSNLIKNSQIIERINKTNPNLKQQSRFSNLATFLKETEYNVGFVDVDSWDTHTGQGSLNGEMKKLCTGLNQDLTDFRNTLGEERWKKTLVVVMSEFGRTLKQNSNGTEHGHGGLLSFFGGIVKKSNIAGEWADLKEENLHEQRDLQVLHENRNILAGLFQKIYGINKEQAEIIFPNSTPIFLDIV